jgi:hypothetical protein
MEGVPAWSSIYGGARRLPTANQFLATFTKKCKSKAKLKGSSTDESSTSSTWKLFPGKTLLQHQHSTNCPGVEKIKARQLTANPGFRNQVVVNGKASLFG